MESSGCRGGKLYAVNSVCTVKTSRQTVIQAQDRTRHNMLMGTDTLIAIRYLDLDL